MNLKKLREFIDVTYDKKYENTKLALTAYKSIHKRLG
jgi:hypothetical protein